MSDLISRSALIKKIRDYADEVGCVRGAYELANGILKAISVVEDTPTVEEKSVHGEWIKIKDWDENDNALFECNNCHHADTHAKSVKVPYCWHCGAKMSYVDM